jgi:hypothetical protein
MPLNPETQRLCICCGGIALGRRQFKCVFRVCSKCTKGYQKGRDIVKAMEVSAATTNNLYIKECLLEGAEILRKVIRVDEP